MNPCPYDHAEMKGYGHNKCPYCKKALPPVACSACGGCTMLPGREEDDDVMNTPCWKCNEHAKLCGNCGHSGDIFDMPPLGDHLHCNHPVIEVRDSPPYNHGWGTLRDARETCPHWIPRQNDDADCSSSEFACQYWHEPKGWCESNVWATETEAVEAHNRIKAAFPDRRYRVIERVTMERIICETHALSAVVLNGKPDSAEDF
jgi:hypothetical protein